MNRLGHESYENGNTETKYLTKIRKSKILLEF